MAGFQELVPSIDNQEGWDSSHDVTDVEKGRGH